MVSTVPGAPSARRAGSDASVSAPGRWIKGNPGRPLGHGRAPGPRGADLVIAESYFFDKKVPFHLDRATRLRHVDEIRPKRLILTHMSRDMLDRVDGAPLTRQAEPA